MINNSSDSDRSRDTFVEQFEPDGADYLYRRDGRGRGLRVTAAERDAFAEEYRLSSQWLLYASGAAGMILVPALILLIDPARTTFRDQWAWLLLGLLVATYFLMRLWLWRAPERRLRVRRREGEDRSPDTPARQLSWIEIAAWATIVAFLIYDQGRIHGFFGE